MNTIYLSSEFSAADNAPCVATIGFFDGVHLGHRFLIQQVVDAATTMNIAATAITFDKHPRQVFQAKFQPKLLTTFAEKQRLLSETHINNCVVLPFSKEMAALSAQEFMGEVLCNQLHVKKLLVGYDHRFGHNREEGFDDYVRYGRQLDMEVVQAKAFQLGDVSVSSSVIRSLLHDGEVEQAAQCLGHPYVLQGKVVAGQQIGRQLGFPTANLAVDNALKLIPATGVYAVNVTLDGSSQQWPAMMNIGVRPTFGGEQLTMEVNIFHFAGDIYNKVLAVEFLRRIRNEQKFATPEALQRQLQRDREQIENELKKG